MAVEVAQSFGTGLVGLLPQVLGLGTGYGGYGYGGGGGLARVLAQDWLDYCHRF